jgi:hypothetical protein
MQVRTRISTEQPQHLSIECSEFEPPSSHAQRMISKWDCRYYPLEHLLVEPEPLYHMKFLQNQNYPNQNQV